MNTLKIRDAQVKDLDALADLCNQLGYPVGTEEVRLRLSEINRLAHHKVYLAETDQAVVGWIHIYLCPLLISSLQAQLGGLIVHSDYRGSGVGQSLMHQAETWARENGCSLLTIFTNVVRAETHEFYDRLGYQVVKTEFVMQKDL